ncbi:class F sortase [Kitasatospora sp. NPDC058046]|uniref:class F sortase n=1 Tax=Kitasatospora sp. NPDC058046 TaxID=3346312 RepID=UPI0036DDEDDE
MWLIAAAASSAVLLVPLVLVPAHSSATGAGQHQAAPVSSAGSADDTHDPLSPSTPLRVHIGVVKLDAPLIALGTDSSGQPELPPYSMPMTAAWLRSTPTPGSAGAAVLAGHVDTPTGPAVFWGLSAVPNGATVDITRLDGSTATFTTDRVQVFPRTRFPTALVYGPTPRAELRMVTCGGPYDHTRHEYLSNVVLFAHLTAATAAASGAQAEG